MGRRKNNRILKRTYLISTLLSCGLLFITACADKTHKSTDPVLNDPVISNEISSDPVTLLSAEQFDKGLKQDPQIQLVDVRTPEEFSDGHLAGALNLDYNSGEFDASIHTLDPSMPVYLYCRSGGRSGRAAQILKENGFQHIYDLDGGITAWRLENRAITY
jgi:phage shock protein E